MLCGEVSGPRGLAVCVPEGLLGDLLCSSLQGQSSLQGVGAGTAWSQGTWAKGKDLIPAPVTPRERRLKL